MGTIIFSKFSYKFYLKIVSYCYLYFKKIPLFFLWLIPLKCAMM